MQLKVKLESYDLTFIHYFHVGLEDVKSAHGQNADDKFQELGEAGS